MNTMDDPIEFDHDRRAVAYSESGKIGVNDLPLVKEFTSFDDLVGFVNGVVGRSNFKITEFRAVVRVDVP